MEVSAPALHLMGDRQALTLSGNINVVSGRYIQPYDLKDRILARRVVEEEEPFWRGDPFLSRLKLDLGLFTKGLLQVSNNVAELRLSTTDFTVGGSLSDLQIGGLL